MSRTGRIVAGAIAVFVWLSLALQFALAMTNPIEPEPGSVERLIRFFSYFTILTNTLVAATLTAAAFFPSSKTGMLASRSSVQAAVAVYISIVGLVYSLFLRGAWNPVGWQLAADIALHDVVPVSYVIYWLIFSPKKGLTWAEPYRWLIYPAIYTGYSLARGAFAMWYPYWFVDVTQLGYPRALANTSFVLCAFVLVGLVYCAIAKFLSRVHDA